MIQIMNLQCSIHVISLHYHGRSMGSSCHGVLADHLFMNKEGNFVSCKPFKCWRCLFYIIAKGIPTNTPLHLDYDIVFYNPDKVEIIQHIFFYNNVIVFKCFKIFLYLSLHQFQRKNCIVSTFSL